MKGLRGWKGRGRKVIWIVLIVSGGWCAAEPAEPDNSGSAAPEQASLTTSASGPQPAQAITVPALPLEKSTSVSPLWPAPSASKSGSSLALYFALLLCLFGGGIYVWRFGFTWWQPKAKGPKKLLISETRMLGNRQFLVVAEYENRKMLIGVCPGRIDYLCSLASEDGDFSEIVKGDIS